MSSEERNCIGFAIGCMTVLIQSVRAAMFSPFPSLSELGEWFVFSFAGVYVTGMFLARLRRV